MSTKDAKEPKETREPKESREPRHRPDVLRQPQRKDSLTSVLNWAGLQGRTLPPRTSSLNSTTSASSTTSATSTSSTQATPTQTTTLKSRRHSHSTDVKKKARKDSTTLRRFSFSNLAAIQENTSAKTKSAKAGKSGSSEKVNRATRDGTEVRKKTSQTRLAGTSQEPKPPITPPPMPKSILRVASPDGVRPPPRHIRSYSASLPAPESAITPTSPPQSPTAPFQPVFSNVDADAESISPPGSPIVRPLSPGVRFSKAIIHRVEVGPGRRFNPVKRRSKSTITYIAPLDPGSQPNTPKVALQSPTKMRRHQLNQEAMGRYWLRMEEEERQWRAERAKQAEEEAERYRAEPSIAPGQTVTPSGILPSPALVAQIKAPEPQRPAWAERLSALDKLPPLDSIPLLDKTESMAKSDVEDKLETVLASDDDDSDADSDGGASTLEKLDDEDGLQDAVGSPVGTPSAASNGVKSEAIPAKPRGEDGGKVVFAKTAESGGAALTPLATKSPMTSGPGANASAPPPSTTKPSAETAAPTKPTEENLSGVKLAVQTLAASNPQAAGTTQAMKTTTSTPVPTKATAASTTQVLTPGQGSATSKPESIKAETPQTTAKTQPAAVAMSAAVPAAIPSSTTSTKPIQPVALPTTTIKTEKPTLAAGIGAGAGVATAVSTGIGRGGGGGTAAPTSVPLEPIPIRNRAPTIHLAAAAAAAAAATRVPARVLSPSPSSAKHASSPLLLPREWRPTSPIPTLRMKHTMANLNIASSADSDAASVKANHLHRSGRRGRRYIEDHKREITA